jgi:hypothetical protein
MSKLRTFGEIEEDYLRNHPDEIDDYIKIVFEEYARDDDIAALLSSLSRIRRAKGVGGPLHLGNDFGFDFIKSPY